MTTLLPSKAAERLEAFLRAAGNGSLTLHIKDGNITKWELKEVETVGRVDNGVRKG